MTKWAWEYDKQKRFNLPCRSRRRECRGDRAYRSRGLCRNGSGDGRDLDMTQDFPVAILAFIACELVVVVAVLTALVMNGMG
jgi:hypothetical protein